MPPPLFMLYSGFGILSAIVLITLLASVLTLLASWALLLFYKRAVVKLMWTQAAERGNQAILRTTGQTSRRDSEVEAVPESTSFGRAAQTLTPDQLYRRTLQGPWRYAGRYAAAGAVYALIMATAGYYAFAQTQINPLAAARHPLQMLFLFWTFLWPMVLTAHVVAASSVPRVYVLTAIYFAALFLVGALAAWIPTEAALRTGDVTLIAWSGETPHRLLAKWGLYNLAPTLLIFAFQNRRVRAVAPLVLCFMTVVSLGLIGGYVGVLYYDELSAATLSFILNSFALSPRGAVIVYLAIVSLLACIAFGAVGWWALRWVRAGYQRKTMSDQSLALDALTLTFAAFYTAIFAFAGLGWAILALAAYAVYKIGVRIGSRQAVLSSDNTLGGPALLILRVFSLGKRSETLFEAVSRHWRYIGHVQVIAGPDLAISTIAPHRFLAFLTGKLSQLFVAGEATIFGSLRQLDRLPDADGRFRINDFFCYADTWKSLLSELVAKADAVMMDLRSFSQNNDGCVFEINQLLNVVPLPKLVFVTDATTDNNFLNQTLAQACHKLPAESPNRGIAPSEVLPLELTSLRSGEVRNLVSRLCHAALPGEGATSG